MRIASILGVGIAAAITASGNLARAQCELREDGGKREGTFYFFFSNRGRPFGRREAQPRANKSRMSPFPSNVVFNRNPFAQVVGNAESDRQIVDWLVDEGYTHVLVNWLEIKRLRASYGFPAEIDESLFDRLAQGGLSPLRHFNLPGSDVRQVSVYAVSRK